MKKRSREEEIFDSLGDPSPEEQAERVADLTDEEVDAELKAQGFDLEKVHARAEALVEKMHAPKKQRSKYLIFGGGFASGGIAIAAAFSVYLASITAVVATAGAPNGHRHFVDQAEEIRAEAFEACGRGEWQKCLDGMDKAKEMDPHTDYYDEEIKGARRRATEALAAAKDGG
jgi:hypothetical protein